MAQAVADPSKRTWLKAADVCERAQVQPYVLRTWEMEFADLGVVKTPGGPRIYRLSSALPGIITGPLSLPLKAARFASSRRPFF